MKYTILICALLLAACVPEQPTEEITQRITILYEHTRIMRDLTSTADAESIGFHTDAWKETQDVHEQLAVVEQMMGLESTGSLEDRVARAEERMRLMMEEWTETPSATAGLGW